MNLSGRVWGATGPEQEASYPCDRLVEAPAEGWTRAVDIAAPTGLAFRWLRQLTIAPYSYEEVPPDTGRIRRSRQRGVGAPPGVSRGSAEAAVVRPPEIAGQPSGG